MNKLRKSKRKSLKKRRIKGSGNCRSRVSVEPVRPEEVLYFKIEWHMDIMNNYVIYDSYSEGDNYLSIELSTGEDWLAHNLEPIPGIDIEPLPTNIMERQVNYEINMLTLRIEDEVRRRVLSGSRWRTAEELRLKRERYKFMAIKNYIERITNANAVRPAESVVMGRHSSSILPDSDVTAAEVAPLFEFQENSLFSNWGGRKRRKSLKKKRKSIKRKKNYFSKRFM